MKKLEEHIKKKDTRFDPEFYILILIVISICIGIIKDDYMIMILLLFISICMLQIRVRYRIEKKIMEMHIQYLEFNIDNLTKKLNIIKITPQLYREKIKQQDGKYPEW